jgi:hypothetical protein
MKRKLLTVVAALVLVTGIAYMGWWLGYRDGITYAYTEVGLEMVSYHVASKTGDSATAAKVVEALTEDTVSMLLDGRHSSPVYFESPLRVDSILSMLRAAWSPKTKYFGSRTLHLHRNPAEHDYAAEFQSIQPASSVRLASRYAPEEAPVKPGSYPPSLPPSRQ